MKQPLAMNRLTPLLNRLKHSQTRRHLIGETGLRVRLRRLLKSRFPALFYDPARHYMRGPGPKASSKQKPNR